MLKIGDFYKLRQVPIKTLRYYDQIGLFTPSEGEGTSPTDYVTEIQFPVEKV